MTDELTTRSRVKRLCLSYTDATIDSALDAYRDAIVAATKAEYEAKLATLTGDISDWETRWLAVREFLILDELPPRRDLHRLDEMVCAAQPEPK